MLKLARRLRQVFKTGISLSTFGNSSRRRWVP